MNGEYLCIVVTEQETHLFFANSTQDQALVGHLRGDFGRGREFWTTWWEKNNDLKTDSFKTELDEVVNALRKDGPLTDFDIMSAFCRDHPEAKLCLQDGREVYGFRIDTVRHRYYLRCIPHRGDYHFYLMCYQSDLFRDYGPKLQARQVSTQKREEACAMSDKMTILVVEPGKAPYVQEIDGSLAAMQKIVGGAIEGAYPFDEPVAIVCNQEGKLEGLPPNRLLTGPDGIPYDMLHGTFFVAGLGAEDFCSLTEEQIRRYQETFRLPGQDRLKKPHKREKER